MRKKFLLLFLAILGCLACAIGFAACGTDTNGGNTDGGGQDTTQTLPDTPKDLISFKTLKVNGDTVYGKVSNATVDFSFINEVTANDGSVFTLSADKSCKDVIPSKTVDLKVGDNVFYILAEKGDEIKLFTVTVRRRPIHTITFNTMGGTAVAAQRVEEDGFLTQIDTPQRSGYTFSNWVVENKDISLPYSVTSSITFKAVYTANQYTVSLDTNGGDALAQSEFTATYDDNFTFVTPTRTGYTFLGWYDGETKVESADWKYVEDKVFTAEWQINTYKVTLSCDNNGSKVVGNGSYEYGSEVELKVVLAIGYSVNGWFLGEDKLSDDLTCNFTIPAVDTEIIVKCEVLQEFANFMFSSSLTSCSISGLKDKSVTEITIPDSVTSIGKGAFSGCSSLESITIPFVGGGQSSSNCLGYIFGSDEYEGGTATNQGVTFYYIPTTLKSVTVTGGTSIGRFAFYGCTGLTSINIPNGVTSIGDSAFYGCTGLTSINIPNGVTSIGDSAFNGCSSLNRINYGGNVASWCGISGLGRGDLMSTGRTLYIDGKELVGELVIPDGVRSIGEYAFYGCTKLTSVTIGNGVKLIGDRAFACTGLISITIPNSITSISEWAFAWCDGLTSITIPDSVTSIGKYAFWWCDALKEINYGGTREQWSSISKGSDWNSNTGNYVIHFKEGV